MDSQAPGKCTTPRRRGAAPAEGLLVLLLGGTSCGGVHGIAVNEMDGGVRPHDAAVSDALVTAETTTADAPPLPFEIPGLAVWLDGDYGVTSSGHGIDSWLDRSPQRHLFAGQTPFGAWPAPASLRGHGAVRFDGRNRIISERDPTEPQADSLTLGGAGFLMAMVFQADASPAESMVLAAVTGPWSDTAPNANVPAPSGSAPLFLFLEPTGVGATIGRQNVVANAPVDFTAPHLLEVGVADDRISLRVDGHEVASEACAPSCATTDFKFAPVFAGNWDFDLRGLEGVVGELVLVKGAAAPAVAAAIEGYLTGKYGLGP
jgi:hypothetical protein